MAHWDHLEKLLADLYRREIDSEENIWRSLPFFSTTLAVEVAILTQVSPAATTAHDYLAWFVAAAASMIVVLVLAVLFFLYRSIRPAQFTYLASDPDLVSYVGAIEKQFADESTAELAKTAKLAFQRLFIDQYATAAAANRAINQRRAQARTRAGTLLLASIVATLVLVAATIGPHFFAQVLKAVTA